MRIALAKGTLRIPPTYFALTHAQRMQSAHQFEMFSLVADVRVTTSVPIHQYVPVHQLGFRRRELIMPAFIPSMVYGLVKFRPDVIHQHFGTWSTPATLTARLINAPLVTTLHGADVFAFSRRSSNLMAKWHHHNVAEANVQSDRLLAVSEFLAGTAVAAGIAAQKLEVHYQGVDTEYFTPSEDASYDSETELPIVLFVGGVSQNKGIQDLLAASSAAYARTPHRLVIVGDGALRPQIERLAVDCPHIEPVGPQAKSAVREWMRKARVLVVPSRALNGAREAAGLVALEAAACGTPVIAYDSGGLREMMLPGSTGLLVAEGQVEDLCNAIEDVVNLPESLYAEMSTAARRFAVQERSLDRSCAELARHYDDVRQRTS